MFIFQFSVERSVFHLVWRMFRFFLFFFHGNNHNASFLSPICIRVINNTFFRAPSKKTTQWMTMIKRFILPFVRHISNIKRRPDEKQLLILSCNSECVRVPKLSPSSHLYSPNLLLILSGSLKVSSLLFNFSSRPLFCVQSLCRSTIQCIIHRFHGCQIAIDAWWSRRGSLGIRLFYGVAE